MSIEDKDKSALKVTTYFAHVRDINGDAHGVAALKDIVRQYESGEDQFIADVLGIRFVDMNGDSDAIRREVESQVASLKAQAMQIEALTFRRQRRAARMKAVVDSFQRTGFWLLIAFLLGCFASSYMTKQYFDSRIDEAASLRAFVHPKTGQVYDVSVRP